MIKISELEFSDYIFSFSEEKNEKLLLERGIGFEEVIAIIQEGLLLDVIAHHNRKKYVNQKIFVVEKNSYVYAVPYIESGNKQIFLKTIFPHRKLKAKYLGNR